MTLNDIDKRSYYDLKTYKIEVKEAKPKFHSERDKVSESEMDQFVFKT